MKYEVLIQPPAEAEIEFAYVYLSERASAESAARWYNELVDGILTSEAMPQRCPIAPEDEYFSEEIRHLLIRPFRVIFTIRGSNVHVLHVRHMSRRTFGESSK